MGVTVIEYVGMNPPFSFPSKMAHMMVGDAEGQYTQLPNSSTTYEGANF